MLSCPGCAQDFNPDDGQTCDSCEQIFCLGCAAAFESCETCGRVFCTVCATSYLQIPSAVTICNECYSEYIEDTDFMFD